MVQMKSGSTVYLGIGLACFTAVLLGVAAAAPGCSVRTDRYCCESEDCGEAFRACLPDYPEFPYCDNTGAFEASNKTPRTCIPYPFDGGSGCVTSDECTFELPVCSADHACVGCTMEAECADHEATPHCAGSADAPGACVACRDSQDCTNVAEPFCEPSTAKCRPCAKDDECASEVCDEGTGQCVDEGIVVYVDGVNGAPGSCSKTAPCKTIQEGVVAVTSTRNVIKIAPASYMETVSVSGKVLVLTGAGVDVQPSALNMPAISVLGAATATGVRIEGLKLHDAGGTGNADGIQCAIGTAAGLPKVTVVDAEIDGNAGQGVDATSCDVTVDHSTVSRNKGGALKVTTGKITLRRSKVIGNEGGGLSILGGGDFVVVNNILAKNGTPTSTFGGVRIDGAPPSGPAGARFEYNTVAGNVAQSGFVSGVVCSFVTVPVAMKNSIVYGNPGATKQVDGVNCEWSYSNIGPGPDTDGEGNINMLPSFVSESTSDFHLMPGSAMVNMADPDSDDVDEDIDGDERPADGRCDMGADEIP